MPDMSPMNVGQLVARIAVGAAVENVVFARYNGCTTNTDNQSPSATDVVIHGSSFDGRAAKCLRSLLIELAIAGSAAES